MPEFKAQKVSNVKAAAPDANYSVKGTDGGGFANAFNKKDLKQLMKSDAKVVYDEKIGKLVFKENGTAEGWGVKKVGGLIDKSKGKPELLPRCRASGRGKQEACKFERQNSVLLWMMRL